MIIKSLELQNFRNYKELKIDFSSGTNILYGLNAQGKTNILEAISIASNIKTFRNIHDSEIIKWNENSYHCSVVVGDSDDRVFEVGCTVLQDTIKKRLKIDGKEIKKAGGYYGRFLTVILSPSDINIINGAPEARRRFFDSVISKIDVTYFEALNEFKKVLASRNRILKEIKYNSIGKNQLDIWDELFSEKASVITNKRHAFIEKYNAIFRQFYINIAESDDPPLIAYDSTMGTNDASVILHQLHEALSRDCIL